MCICLLCASVCGGGLPFISRERTMFLTHIFSLSFLLPFPNKLKNNLVISHFNKQQMMKEQDQGLEMLGQSAERLSKISMGIHEELGHQNK